MEKLDLTKQYKSYFTAKPKPELVKIEQAQFLSITGKGDPSDEKFAKKIQALYTTAYSIKFTYKALQKDFVVSKLEALWWFDEKKYENISITDAPLKIPREQWEYRLLIRLPDYVTNEDVVKGVEIASVKKGILLAKEVELFKMNEGNCVQILHVGPFATEIESLTKIANFSTTNNLLKNGLHHEIYLSDFRKTPAEKLKTILREPVK